MEASIRTNAGGQWPRATSRRSRPCKHCTCTAPVIRFYCVDAGPLAEGPAHALWHLLGDLIISLLVDGKAADAHRKSCIS